MLSQDEHKAIRDGTFDLNCPIMELRQTTSDTPKVYSGPGFIRLDKDGKIRFRLFSPQLPMPSALHMQLAPWLHMPAPGTLIPENAYWMLDAIDQRGRRWSGARLIPLFDAGETVIVHGNLRYVALHEGAVKSNAFARLHAIRPITLPWNSVTKEIVSVGDELWSESYARNVAKLQACACDFVFEDTRPGLKVTVQSSDAALPAQLDSCIAQALQFISGKEVTWLMTEHVDRTSTVTRVHARHELPLDLTIHPPINCNVYGPTNSVWVLFEKYLHYVLKPSQMHWHPLSQWMHSVIEGKGGSIFAYALSLAVAVEGVLETAYEEVGLPSEQFCVDIRTCMEQVQSLTKNQSIQKRLTSSLGGMLKPSAQDRLWCLERCGVVRPHEIKAWKRLRHPAAHGKSRPVRVEQEFLDTTDCVLGLFYRLICHTIGYSGELTEYCQRGWPVAQFESRPPVDNPPIS